MTAAGTVIMSSTSLQYIIVPVQVTKAGLPYNPTADVVQFLFTQNVSGTPTAPWVGGTWVTTPNLNYPYAAQCLVGTGGATALTVGTYVIWVKVTDSPEIPVLQAGELQII